MSNINEFIPIGEGYFGKKYAQFKGKPKEACEFLMINNSGDLIDVFHHSTLGSIDLVWGTEVRGEGLEHIIRKHIEQLKDFQDIDELISILKDVIQNGEIVKSKWDKFTIANNGYKVVIRKNVRDEKGVIVETNKNWIVTAFNDGKTKKEKASANT